MNSQTSCPTSLDVAVIGAGFSGLYALHRLRSDGWNVRAFEAGPDIGGTWYFNRYPGARCDVQSLAYCYTFDEQLQRDWRWSERYPTQSEILRYIHFVADTLDLRRHITLRSRVLQAIYDEERHSWAIAFEDGQTVQARYLIMATGALSAGHIPAIPGTRDFEGEVYHTGSWPHSPVDLQGKRVAVIGTGSSGVQCIPVMAKEATQLLVFQRTPAFVAPARNAPLRDIESVTFREQFADYRRRLKAGELIGCGDIIHGEHLPPTAPVAMDVKPAERRKLLQDRWDIGGFLVGRTFGDYPYNQEADDILADFFREKIRETVVDPSIAERLVPKGFPISSRRLCVGSDYYESFNRENVLLVDIKADPIVAIDRSGIVTEGARFDVDIIVFATGFDAVTGAITQIDIRGRGGAALRDEWSEGPETYLGLSVAAFPNLFLVTGPGSPSVNGNMVINIEQHVEFVGDLLNYARDRGATAIEVQAASQKQWTSHVSEVAAPTLAMKEGNRSWWVGSNIPGKPRVLLAYMPGISEYSKICSALVADGYPGFEFTQRDTSSDV